MTEIKEIKISDKQVIEEIKSIQKYIKPLYISNYIII